MKKLFTFFCAVCLMPNFSAQAWIGGPFSNNSFFSDRGDDGVYEAVGVPIQNPRNPRQVQLNGIGIFRWAVTNNTSFDDEVTTSVSQVFFDNAGNIAFTLVDVQPLTSNVYFGGVGQISHTWFIEGIAYRGNCDGTANSGLGFVSCIGNASDPTNPNSFISSSFKARFESSGEGLPISRYSGRGRGSIFQVGNALATRPFIFEAFGSKVTTRVTYNASPGT